MNLEIVDFCSSNPKNLQHIGSIKIHYKIYKNYYKITYSLNIIDINILKQLIEFHLDCTDDYFIENYDDDITTLDKIYESNETYIVFSIYSINYEFYLNIYYIPFIEFDDGSNNMDEMLRLNL
jgi:hypothetical protein